MQPDESARVSHPRGTLRRVGVALPPSLSPSSISQFKECPLAFKFSYVERLPQPPSPWTSKGTLVHRALELLMGRPGPDRTIDAALDDLATATAELSIHPDFTELTLSDDEWAAFHADAAELVRKYFTLEDPTTVSPIGLELKLEARLGDIRVRGIIDRLDLDADGELVVIDYKTGSVPGERFEAKSLAGVHMYALLCEQMLGRRPARVQLYYLSKPAAIIATPTEQTVNGALVGNRGRGRARRLPSEPGPPLRLLRLPPVLPRARRRPRRGCGAAGPRRSGRAHPAARAGRLLGVVPGPVRTPGQARRRQR